MKKLFILLVCVVLVGCISLAEAGMWLKIGAHKFINLDNYDEIIFCPLEYKDTPIYCIYAGKHESAHRVLLKDFTDKDRAYRWFYKLLQNVGELGLRGELYPKD